MSKNYTSPSWGSLPKDEYRFEVLKEDKSYFIVGRQPDVCDFLLDHPSVSRQHAVLQFRDDGALMILDLDSAHGTFVNKKQCVQKVYQKLYVGDVVRFGASSRQYILNGPHSDVLPEYDSANMQQYREKLANKSAKARLQHEEIFNNGISWGFGDDAEIEEDEEEDKEEELPDYVKKDPNYNRKYADKFSSSIKDSEVHEKDKEILEKIRTKERKIQNMQEEIKRIYLKEGSQESGLTEGQIAAVSRNDTQIARLKEQIEDLERTISEKSVHRTQGEKANNSVTKNKMTKDSRRDDDDEVLDTTEQTADVSTNWRLRKKLAKHPKSQAQASEHSQALTYEDLVGQRDTLQASLEDIRIRLTAARALLLPESSGEGSGGAPSSAMAVAPGEGAGGGEEEDEIEAVVRSGRVKDAEAEVKVASKLEAEVLVQLQRVQRLLRIATPALPSLVQTAPHKPVSIQSAARTPPAVTADMHVTTTSLSSTPLDSQSSNRFLEGKCLEEKQEKSSVKMDVTLGGEDVLRAAASISPATSHESESCGDSSVGLIVNPNSHLPLTAVVSVAVSEKVSLDGSVSNKRLFSSTSMSAVLTGGDDEAAEQSNVVSKSKKCPPHSCTAESSTSSTHRSNGADNGSGSAVCEAEQLGGADIRTRGNRSRKDSDKVKAKQPVGPSRPPTGTLSGTGFKAFTATGAKLLEGGDLVWLPPTSQTGDGKTKLNEKFGY